MAVSERNNVEIMLDNVGMFYDGADGKHTDTPTGKFEKLYGEWKAKNITGRDFMRKMDLSVNTF